MWWFLGSTGEVIRGGNGLIKEGYRAAPGWLSPISHPLIVAWRCRSPCWRGVAARTRCAARAPVPAALRLDPWNTAYYALPAILALVAWEATSYDRPPLLALAMTMATWATWEWVVPTATADVEALFYLAWTLPLIAFLGWRLYAPAFSTVPTLSSGGRASVWSTTQ